VYEKKGATLVNLEVSGTYNLEIPEFDVSSMPFQILKPDTGHGPDI
jgi:hypothetical protein